LLRYWSQSRSPLLPSVRRDEPWDRLKGCRVADAVIKAQCYWANIDKEGK
jgi:hypothetical protein